MNSKNVFQAIIFLLLLCLVFFLFASSFGERYDEKLDGRSIKVSWKTVNIREKPSTSSKILGTLKQGDVVLLNGQRYESMDGPYPSWVQLENGGWIVTNAFSGNW